MDLKTYFRVTKPAERKVLAESAGTSVDYLYLCSRGTRKPGAELCKALVKLEPRFTLADLRPDIWGNGIDAAAASDDVQPPAGTPSGNEKLAKMVM
ncbi:hypothetical protein [Burkholderia vietnamiensis]|uniref:hypothetical protein n=1 Tax=Burkholderia vietnamiensis TaxID=60552 RepID=UPI0015935546|nr:hypothetical protein [Burkholderia vietnamiensis]